MGFFIYSLFYGCACILNLNMNADFTFKKSKYERIKSLYYSSADINFERAHSNSWQYRTKISD